jgi:hypothetical protein
MAEKHIYTRPPITRNRIGVRLMKIWSSDLSATQIPPMCCRVYGEVCNNHLTIYSGRR